MEQVRNAVVEMKTKWFDLGEKESAHKREIWTRERGQTMTSVSSRQNGCN